MDGIAKFHMAGSPSHWADRANMGGWTQWMALLSFTWPAVLVTRQAEPTWAGPNGIAQLHWVEAKHVVGAGESSMGASPSLAAVWLNR